jgi:universal stress protein A
MEHMKKSIRQIQKEKHKGKLPNIQLGREVTSDFRVVPSNSLNIKSILVPLDFSIESKKALAYAISFARQFGAKLTLLHVVEPIPETVLAMENEKVMENCKRALALVVKANRIEQNLMEKILVRYGRSFNEIAEAARTLKIDLIIIATHGYTGLKHVFLGSTTERVVRHAPCPVLVVRSHEHEFCGQPS